MAIHVEENGMSGTVDLGATVGNHQQQTNSGQAQMGQTGASNDFLGFGLNPNLAFLSTTNGSIYANELLAEGNKFIAGQQNIIKTELSLLDIEGAYSGMLAYSTIIVATNINGKLYFHPVLIEKTGQSQLTVGRIVSEYAAATQNRFNNPKASSLYTAADAIDTILVDHCEKFLRQKYGKDAKLINTEASVIWSTNDEVTSLAAAFVTTAYNANIAESLVVDKISGDINITQAIRGGKQLRLRSAIGAASGTSGAGEPLKTDFALSLMVSNGNQQQTLSPNSQGNGDIPVLSLSGCIEFIAERTPLPQTFGQPTVDAVRFRPNIVLNNISNVQYPTAGYLGLSIAVGAMMLDKNMYNQVLVQQAAVRDIGTLNVMANLEGNANKQGAVLPLGDKKYKPEEIAHLVAQLVPLAPALSIDVTSGSNKSYLLSILNAIAQDNDIAKRNAAGKFFISSLVTLTNGIFPADFDVNSLFINSGVMLPAGFFADGKGKLKDINEIDLQYVIKSGADNRAIYEMALANLPQISNGTVDPMATKINMLNMAAPDAIIYSKTRRLTFTSAFIGTLASALKQAGLVIGYEQLFNITDPMAMFTSLGSGFGNAGIDFGNGYGQQFGSFSNPKMGNPFGFNGGFVGR